MCIRDSDAYCGVAYVTSDWVDSGAYFNTLYSALNSDNYPNSFPPFTEQMCIRDR